MAAETPTQPAPLPLLTSAEVQKILHCRPRTLHGYISRGELPVVRLNSKRLLFDRDDVRAFIAARKERRS